MIHDVARLAQHSRAREEALSRLCARLAAAGELDHDASRSLAAVADNCAARAALWATRAPDPAYIAVGRPVPGDDPDASGDAGSPDDPVLADLAAADEAESPVMLQAVLRALADVESAYVAQAAAVDGRLDPPTALTVAACQASIANDRSALGPGESAI